MSQQSSYACPAHPTEAMLHSRALDGECMVRSGRQGRQGHFHQCLRYVRRLDLPKLPNGRHRSRVVLLEEALSIAETPRRDHDRPVVWKVLANVRVCGLSWDLREWVEEKKDRLAATG